MEKHQRSLLKAVSWRVLGTMDTMALSYIITKDFKIAFSIGAIEIFTKMTLYYLHERFWNKVNIGKISIDQLNQKDEL